MNIQVNLTIPDWWKPILEQKARIISVEEKQTVGYIDLIRRAISEVYELDRCDNE